ncbi:Wzz/FepE/Etk N-terminal domain-containing protein [Cetobacterium somerae]|uniref:Wzz/FepE/Etk N-terminal domain-containing protein n=1 Tax=Cetobacterium somerae TaxID=188913 RepID=UPI001F05A793|nr:Wzz/FepE/Etk N-terminal domain-containing protein [Cetobacterium somerae]UPO97401.1 Wzz/FepE/Etk N-terminal domain-containing protein [Cetobacterium somerae]
MSKELKVMEQKQYDDEIDLYELIEILVRHKWSIVITTVLCTLLSLGTALYVRSKTPNYLIKSILIQQDTYGLKGVNKINVDTVLLQDKNIEKLLEIESIKKEYLENTPEKMQNMASERKFLQELITISKNEKNNEEISIKTEIIVNESSSRDIINKYIDILREQDNLADVIAKEKELKGDSLEKTKIEIENIQNEILDIFKKDNDLIALKPEEKMNYIASKYPELNLRKNEQEKYYNTYVNELIRLDSLNDKADIIKETTDIYFLKGQSKAKLILVVGIIMGVFLGVMIVFLKEFINGYKKRYKK